ncbi:Phosphatidylinositol 3- and 4-kinase family protein [Histomonas meleagridis]|uniref:Phosphatidylinositol 3- and 4-kinase family protein n=1 Tax=Histomonas meleagridis TaxID=135588 RepID=UPI00355ABABD|nr:Phosphatidylinositol 3- and 4-kinase family protein [Histomonas meleagridis]KAH0799035.1 Phosphatidylinositol 3- and 4-kinase family protein [Histomonas meleagridis]
MNPSEPQFLYYLSHKETSFELASQQYIKDFDLVSIKFDPETRSLNNSLAIERREIEKQRVDMLTKNPLMTQMRISEVYPPLNLSFITTNEQEISSPENQSTSQTEFQTESTAQAVALVKSRGRLAGINLKVDLRSSDITGASTTGLSVRVPYDETANGAIRMISEKFQKLTTVRGEQMSEARRSSMTDRPPNIEALVQKNDNPINFNPEDYVLVIPGMDEIIAGDTILIHFVCVRQFILSGQPIMNLLLVEKKTVIDSIFKMNLNYKIDANDLSDSKTSTPNPTNTTSKEPQPSDEKLDFTNGFPHNRAKDYLSVFISRITDLDPTLKPKRYLIQVTLIHGTQNLVEPQYTQVVYGSGSILFNERIFIPLPISNIPRAARISFTLYKATPQNKKKKGGGIATYNFPVFLFDGWLNSGEFIKKMWHHGIDYFLTTCESNESNPIRIHFNLPLYKYPIYYCPPNIEFKRPNELQIEEGSLARIKELRKMDPLTVLEENDRQLLWNVRCLLLRFSDLLPLFLSSIDYTKPEQVSEVQSLLQKWEKPSATSSLTLLDAKFADPIVRKYAVERLKELSDDEVRLYLLQLVQALKYELYDDSPLVHFLIKRCTTEPKFLGHSLFWQLMSEAHLSHIRDRFTKILINFVHGIGRYKDELLKAYQFTCTLVSINKEMEQMDHTMATDHLRQRLKSIEIPEEFHLPMDPRLIVKSFIIDQCKVMNSKKKPFWLTFENNSKFANGPVQTLFKVGDDLRQDQLTLQVMSVMEHLWQKEGLDLRMSCYGVLPTGLNQGFIEVVPNSTTEAALQQQQGTFSDEIYYKYISENGSNKSLPISIETFRLSSAGYAVATCVLGIGDRHPGNIMIQKDGHFLHIDFGHFLGNFKTKLGVQREKAPFHFTSASVNVINREPNGFALFEQDCGRALNILRKNSNLIITLFLLMIGTGIPELRKPKDIVYMKNMLMLDKTDEEAALEFNKKIKQSLESTRTKLNNWIHNIATN